MAATSHAVISIPLKVGKSKHSQGGIHSHARSLVSSATALLWNKWHNTHLTQCSITEIGGDGGRRSHISRYWLPCKYFWLLAVTANSGLLQHDLFCLTWQQKCRKMAISLQIWVAKLQWAHPVCIPCHLVEKDPADVISSSRLVRSYRTDYYKLGD